KTRPLVDADDWGEAINLIDVGPLELMEKLPSIDRETFDILPLPLGKQRVERQTTLAGTARPGNDDQLAAGDVQVDILEVVRSRAADSQAIGSDGARRRERWGS